MYRSTVSALSTLAAALTLAGCASLGGADSSASDSRGSDSRLTKEELMERYDYTEEELALRDALQSDPNAEARWPKRSDEGPVIRNVADASEVTRDSDGRVMGPIDLAPDWYDSAGNTERQWFGVGYGTSINGPIHFTSRARRRAEIDLAASTAQELEVEGDESKAAMLRRVYTGDFVETLREKPYQRDDHLFRHDTEGSHYWTRLKAEPAALRDGIEDAISVATKEAEKTTLRSLLEDLEDLED